jgi:hypothetical protein
MNNQILLFINLGVSALLLVTVIWLIIRHQKLDQARKEFFSSGLKKDLEQILVDQNRSITKINQEIDQLQDGLDTIYKDNRQNIQKIGFVRFNPFDDAGGNISFALALLNAKDEGVVISSLHGREGTRMYAKQVTAGHSQSQLTEEEMEAIKEAK